MENPRIESGADTGVIKVYISAGIPHQSRVKNFTEVGMGIAKYMNPKIACIQKGL